MINLVKPAYAVICNSALKDGCSISSNPQNYFNNVLQVVISLLFIVAIIYFVWNIILAGYHMVSSQGDPKSFDTAKNQLLYAFVGLFIIFFVFALLKLIGTVTGITGLDSLSITLPSL